MSGFILDKDLISANQSGFKTEDSCMNQLFSKMHNIYKSFDDGYEVRSFFLDIPTAFDKVCNDLYSNYKKMGYRLIYQKFCNIF